MLEPTKIVRKKCGQIFILANDIISLICEFCDEDLQASLEDFRAHLTEHFPNSPTIVKNEDSISCGSYIEFIPDEIQDDVKYNCTDDLQGCEYDGSRSSLADVDLSLSIGKEIIQSELKLNFVTTNVEDVAETGESDDGNGMQAEIRSSRKDANEAQPLAAADVSHTFQCDICQWSTTRKSTIPQHMRNIHNNEGPFDCNVCSKSFALKSVMNQHLRTHTDEKPQKCHVCNKSFSVKRYLAKHMLTHTGEKPHKCDVCTQSFSQKCSISYHMKTHTGEKPHKCDVCSKRFSLKGNLIYHMKTHTGERSHKCDVCSKSFWHKYRLVRHMLTHAGEKSHKCYVCNKSFLQKYNLTEHMKTHTGEKSHKCNVCSKSFSRKNNLAKHLKTHTS